MMASRHRFNELSFTFAEVLIKLCRAPQICNYSLCTTVELKAKQCPPRYYKSPCDKSQNDWLWHHGEGLQSFEVEREKMPECVLCFMACAFLSKGPAFIFVSQSQGINHACLSLFCPQPFSFSVCRFCSISHYYHYSLSFFFLSLCALSHNVKRQSSPANEGPVFCPAEELAPQTLPHPRLRCILWKPMFLHFTRASGLVAFHSQPLIRLPRFSVLRRAPLWARPTFSEL